MSDPLPPAYDKTYLSIEKDDEQLNHRLAIMSNTFYGETEQDDVISIYISMERRDDGNLTDRVSMEFTAQEARLFVAALTLIADNADRVKTSVKPDAPDAGERGQG